MTTNHLSHDDECDCEADNEAGMLAHIDDLTDTNKMLLEALKAITDCYFVGTSATEYVRQVHDFMVEGRAAITKAEGR